MSITTPSARALATYGGAAIVAAAAHTTILKTGGYTLSGSAPLITALALGVIAGARAIGGGDVPKRLGIGLLIALAAGEAYNLASTLDRSVEAREDMQAPVRALHEKHDKAVERLADLESGIYTTQRVTLAREAVAAARAGSEGPAVVKARAALKSAQDAVDAEAANVSCKRECRRKQDVAEQAREDLKAAIAADNNDRSSLMTRAEAELAAALAASDSERATAIATAKAELLATPAPRSATPTADRIGLAPWAWDMLLAVALSIGANGLAAMLLAYGASPDREPDGLSELAALRSAFSDPIPDNPDGPPVAQVIRLPRKPDGRTDRRGPSPDRPKRPGPAGPGGLSKAQAFEDLMQRLTDGRTIGSQDELAADWHRPKQTVSDWMREWRRIGAVPQAIQAGRCKVTAGS